MKYITFQENFIQDAANKVSSVGSAIKNRVQTNIGNAANAVNGAIRSVKEFGQGISDRARSASNVVTKAANAVGAKGLVRPNQAPLISDQARAVKNSISNGVSKAASMGRSFVSKSNSMLNKARSYISG
jgi:phage-related protein